MKKGFYRFLFRLFGWKIKGNKPTKIKKYIIVVAPHTSNLDFFLGVATRAITGLKSYYLAKKELFTFPVFGGIFKALGGIPVDRSKKSKMVDQVVEILQKSDPDKEMAVAVTPEGTRSYAAKWKTGFWHIANSGNIPIVMVGFDYGRKVVEFKEPFYTTDKEQDMEMMKAYFRTIKGKHPEKGVR